MRRQSRSSQLAIPEEYSSWRGCLAIDEYICGTIRSEICEFDIIFIIPIGLLHGAPRRVFSFGRARNRARFHLAVRLMQIDIATNRSRIWQPSRQGETSIDLH